MENKEDYITIMGNRQMYRSWVMTYAYNEGPAVLRLVPLAQEAMTDMVFWMMMREKEHSDWDYELDFPIQYEILKGCGKCFDKALEWVYS